MSRLIKYIEETIGITIQINPIQKEELESLPMYLNQLYKLQKIVLGGKPCLLVEINKQEESSVAQLEKHFKILKTKFNIPVIALFDEIEAYQRKRLIEKKIAFILVGKQMYVPDFFIDLKEYGVSTKKTEDKLIPSAQQILLMYILYQNDKNELENKTFKELASFFNTNPMAITRAVENLKQHDLIDVTGEKEKYIKFNSARSELWYKVTGDSDLLSDPVIKRIFVDELPKEALLRSNTSALPEYTDMNPSRQSYYAIEKSIFYALQRNNKLVNPNKHEGKYCLEVWKYNPLLLVEGLNNDRSVVDPLSLYLSLKEEDDARIEMALEQIIDKYIW